MRIHLRKLLIITLPSVLVAVAVAALATEVWVRATWDPKRGTPGLSLADPVLVERLAPNYDGWFAGVPVRINNLGFRDDRDYSLEKGPRTIRILVLGDSVTFGHGSIYEHTYPYLLEQQLRRWRPDVVVHTDSNTFLDLSRGTLTPRTAEAEGDLQVEGNRRLFNASLRVFAAT